MFSINSNLIKRIITAAILIPIVILLITQSNSQFFLYTSIVFAILIAKEWTELFNFSLKLKLFFITSILLFLYLYYRYYFSLINQQIIFNYLMLITMALWIILFILVIKFNFIKDNDNSNATDRKQFFMTDSLIDLLASNIINMIKNNKFIQYILGFFIINLFILTLNYLKNININGAKYLIFLLILIWTIDTGSYIFGKFFGKNKLLANVSPGKTVEGAVGGLICLHFMAILLYYNFTILNYHFSLVLWLLIANLIYLFAILGDLVESLFKRIMMVKDSGNLFPGHGGVLDRIDSLLSTTPVYYYCLSVFILNLN